MSTDTATTDHDVDAHGHDAGHAHFGFNDAIKIAVILAVITALETATHWTNFSSSIEDPAVVIMMIAKFVIVVAYFMHLKFENKMFTYLFVAGVVLAICVYIVTLLTFNYF